MPVRDLKRIPRKWEVFPGRNSFFCNGRIVMAQRAGLFYLCVVIIVLTSSLFFAVDCPYLSVNVSPAIPVVAAVLFISVMSNLFKTSFSDPGIIPRATKAEAADTEHQIEAQTVAGNGTAYRPPPRTKEIVIKNQTLKLKYCFTCKIFRPPRASHCSICDHCVDRFDHHCPWVGNCVGLRNYRYFYMFLVSLAIQCVFFFTCALGHLVLVSRTKESNFLGAIKESPTSVVVCIICFLSVWSVVGLAGFHTYLVTSNLTTNEDLKGAYSNRRTYRSYNPFNAGNGVLNCHQVLCDPLPPSLVDLRGRATDDFITQRLHDVSTKSGEALAPMGNPHAGGYMIQNFHTINESERLDVPYDSVVTKNGETKRSHQIVDRRLSQGSEKSLIGSNVPSSVPYQTSVTGGVLGSTLQIQQDTTMPEISSFQLPATKLPPMTSSPPENRLIKEKTHQTTMMGSALDLHSLNGDEHQHVRDANDEESRISAGAESKVGLLQKSTA